MTESPLEEVDEVVPDESSGESLEVRFKPRIVN